MKYYALLTETELNITNMPNKFPVFVMCTDEDKRRYSALMVKAAHFGFDPKTRKLCFTVGCKEGYTHEEIYEKVKELPEITQDIFNILNTIPHWNPIMEATKILERYIEMVSGNISIMETCEATREALDISIADVKKIREIFINT
jgi:hypothetical protein